MSNFHSTNCIVHTYTQKIINLIYKHGKIGGLTAYTKAMVLFNSYI